METRSVAAARPAIASTAIAGLLAGPPRAAVVAGSSRFAAYIAIADPEADPGMLALIAPGAVRLPIALCVPADALPPAGSPAIGGDGVVRCATGAWRAARWWDPRPRLDRGGLIRNGWRLLDAALAEPPGAFGLPVLESLIAAAAVATDELAPALAVVGRGPGLTPAGDDVLAGALAALRLGGLLDRRTVAAINERAATHTTTLSAALLRAAGDGQVVPEAARVLSALAAGSRSAVVRGAAAGLFDVGSTSGHDLCLGMAGALAAIRSHSRKIEEAAA